MNTRAQTEATHGVVPLSYSCFGVRPFFQILALAAIPKGFAGQDILDVLCAACSSVVLEMFSTAHVLSFATSGRLQVTLSGGKCYPAARYCHTPVGTGAVPHDLPRRMSLFCQKTQSSLSFFETVLDLSRPSTDRSTHSYAHRTKGRALFTSGSTSSVGRRSSPRP